MDFNAIIEPAIKFFSTGIGAMIAEFARAIYNALYPANAGTGRCKWPGQIHSA